MGILDELPDISAEKQPHCRKKQPILTDNRRLPLVTEPPRMRCPKCKSLNLRTYGTVTTPKHRYRQCRDCGFQFVSVENLSIWGE